MQRTRQTRPFVIDVETELRDEQTVAVILHLSKGEVVECGKHAQMLCCAKNVLKKIRTNGCMTMHLHYCARVNAASNRQYFRSGTRVNSLCVNVHVYVYEDLKRLVACGVDGLPLQQQESLAAAGVNQERVLPWIDRRRMRKGSARIRWCECAECACVHAHACVCAGTKNMRTNSV